MKRRYLHKKLLSLIEKKFYLLTGNKNKYRLKHSLDEIYKNLIFLYGEEKGEKVFSDLATLLEKNFSKTEAAEEKNYFSEKDITLISYANSFQEKGTPTLETLHTLLDERFKGVINSIHILPFNPDGLDRGFSVVDFKKVKKEFGTWKDIEAISNDFRLMADLVLNHISSKSEWFQKFLAGDPQYQDYFISFAPEELTPEVKADIQKVFRPRATPLLTKFETKNGPRHIWTTYSVVKAVDQIDLNYQNPQVLLEMIHIVLLNLEHGVRILRLDAIAYAWKELGTSCIHLPQAHALVQILRDVLDVVCPSALLITETNVQHKENLSYFGNGLDEGQMIYNFSLPPLILYSLFSGNASYLTNWAKTLKLPTKQTAFFNFLSAHDGVPVLGARKILPEKEIDTLFKKIEKKGAKFNYKNLAGGGQTVYEMCITWWSALEEKGDDFDVALRRYITSYAIGFSLAGVAAVYYSHWFGLKNNVKGWEKSKLNRDMVREDINYDEFVKQLDNPSSHEAKVFAAMSELAKARRSHPAFHPTADQQVLDLDTRVVAFLRSCPEETVLAIHNVSSDDVHVTYKGHTYELVPYGFIWQPLVD